MIETVKEKALRLNHKFVCPECKHDYGDSDSELSAFVVDMWDYSTNKLYHKGMFECPHCGCMAEEQDFYE